MTIFKDRSISGVDPGISDTKLTVLAGCINKWHFLTIPAKFPAGNW